MGPTVQGKQTTLETNEFLLGMAKIDELEKVNNKRLRKH